MNQDSPSPAAHLVRFGVATSRNAYRMFLHHAWMETDIAKDSAHTTEATRVFEKALERQDTQFPLGTQPWTGVLARALRRVAKLFADEGLAIRFSETTAGAPIAPVLNAFAPLCAEMDSELEASGFEIHLAEPESALRRQLAALLPLVPVVPEFGAPSQWLPDLFAGMMHAAIWREIVAEPPTLKLAAAAAADFFAGVFNDITHGGTPPTTAMMEQEILVFTPKAVDYGLGQIARMTVPAAAADLEAKALPYLRAAFSRETPLAPVVAAIPMMERAAPPRPTPQLPTVPVLRAIPKSAEAMSQDDDYEMPLPSGHGLRWIIGAVGFGLVVAAILPFLGDGAIDTDPALPENNAPLAPVNESLPKGPERMIVSAMDPLLEPEQVPATPISAVRPIEKAQSFIDAAVRAKRAGDHRQAAEDMSRALLIFKHESGERRWSDERYLRLRGEFRAQLGLLNHTPEQVSAIEDVVGAREDAKPNPEEKADLAKVAATFQRGDEELERGRPKVAAEIYELALRTGLAILGEKHTTNRTYQQYLSRYIDFLIGENLEPDKLHLRIGLVKAGRKPEPLPDKKLLPEPTGLGLPKL